ncbi:NAD(P)-dependent dehydrogenase, short-chain alcohol dehydrogenase family [Hymenobacter daecheongensis DSM 21074]|uniref:NAD(P)-dependent dehydrogenase, short-chain alcohol dehydrogenase family n=1 Tax=Hymenobacter daecheongensis DSM 21074 TaxID=1121955 RepID=A0A1M6KNZ0_9BACT|nr:SDR family oxidoreductase [Hymenobacter daecheongensis]SHJ60718.1 NAD(P)-dependent dehydrogenase, short-chain alcohol dehydrogenase family [Hymenobacter daecheongensis DSM 21074]
MTTNKIALVTGGSRGLGKNSALHLAQAGHDLIITYRQQEAEARAVVAQIEALGRKAVALPLDVGRSASFPAFAETLAQHLEQHWNRASFDFLINNAGIDAPSPFAQTTEEDFDNLLNVHFKGVYFLTQKLLPLLADGGGIVNFSTGLARFTTPGYAAYASMKGAVETLTKYMAKELGGRGIRANVVAPGIIKTDFTAAARTAHPQLEQYMAGNTALGRIGEPDDIGGVVAFLCSEAARWVNAQRIEASGGYSL